MAEPPRGAEPLWRTPPGRLAPPHVYRMASALGAELRRLSGRFGPDAVAGLVPPVVRLLELLEALVAPVTPAGSEGEGQQDAEDLEQRLWEAERRERALHGRLAHLEEQNQQLLGQLAESQSQEDSTARKEREVMLRLKEVVDKQRDEIRAQAHEIVCKSRDTEAVSAGELEDVKGLGTCFPVPSPGPVSQACRGRCLSHAVQALVALVAAERCCCGSLGAAVGFPAPGAAAALHVHERGPAAQG
uniref:RH1 domain-containing protein n=1 Tax=Anas platyrhynchos platyrhynchos TaxID=8840 RepID=A0A493TAV2_ANAPP